MNRQIQAASDLIGMIYDCVVDPENWPHVLEAACRKIRFHYGALSLQTLPSGIPLLHACSGLAPEWLARIPDYSADFIERWGGRQRVDALPLSEPAILSRVNPEWASPDSRYYREWAQPLGIHDIMALGMVREPSAIGSIILARHHRQGPITRQDLETARLILPHAQRAIAISRILETRRLTISSLHSVLDQIPVGVVLVNASCRILHANRTGIATLEAGHPVASRQGRFHLNDPDLDRRLAQSVREAARGFSPDLQGVDFPLRDTDGKGYMVQILPVSAHSRTMEVVAGAAVIFIKELSPTLPAPHASFAAVYGLSKAEAVVLAKIAQGSGVVEAARQLGLSAATVKTHLQHIFDKTGVRRQADLVALVSSSRISSDR
ncbi:helix-turn-helix transcriptional regulator [Paracoccus aestuariivivens]|uniref:HTH luxR-type domain-containing protein n=1 Tax=Paracoccus aestuariivivens TaxID=1820333 RepID=A0A6L6JH87_9RHOB|nr:helix-turn-helix transcriptional regulator [Paracoccus aestuariivivens]MTH79241.1 hypothetical protein [Paracoccus aestuariivivens]